MAIIRNRQVGPLPPQYVGHFYERKWRGLTVLSKWPRKRGKPTDPAALERIEKFHQAIELCRYVSAATLLAAKEATIGTSLMPYDLMVKAMYGRLFMMQCDDGRILRSRAVVNDVSQNLDLLTTTFGSVLVRGQDGWTGVPPGQSGYVLTSQGTNDVPAWAPSSGGGSVLAPPKIANFTWGNQPSGTTATDTSTGLAIAAPGHSGENWATLWWNGTYPTTPFTQTILVKLPPILQTVYQLGLLIGNAAGKFISCGCYSATALAGNPANVRSRGFANVQYNSPTSFASIGTTWQFEGGEAAISFTDDGTNIVGKIGTDINNLIQVFSVTRASFIGTPTKIGIGLSVQNQESQTIAGAAVITGSTFGT